MELLEAALVALAMSVLYLIQTERRQVAVRAQPANGLHQVVRVLQYCALHPIMLELLVPALAVLGIPVQCRILMEHL